MSVSGLWNQFHYSNLCWHHLAWQQAVLCARVLMWRLHFYLSGVMSSGLVALYLKRGMSKLHSDIRQGTISEYIPIRKLQFKDRLGKAFAILVTDCSMMSLWYHFYAILSYYKNISLILDCAHSNKFCQHGSHTVYFCMSIIAFHFPLTSVRRMWCSFLLKSSLHLHWKWHERSTQA